MYHFVHATLFARAIITSIKTNIAPSSATWSSTSSATDFRIRMLRFSFFGWYQSVIRNQTKRRPAKSLIVCLSSKTGGWIFEGAWRNHWRRTSIMGRTCYLQWKTVKREFNKCEANAPKLFGNRVLLRVREEVGFGCVSFSRKLKWSTFTPFWNCTRSIVIDPMLHVPRS